MHQEVRELATRYVAQGTYKQLDEQMKTMIINRSVELVELALKEYTFIQASGFAAWVSARQNVHFNIITEEMSAWCKEKNVKPNTISLFIRRTFSTVWEMNQYGFTSFDQLKDLEPKMPRSPRSHSIVNQGLQTNTRGIKYIIRKNYE